MKHVFYFLLIMSSLILSGCGQYGMLYLPTEKNDQKPMMSVTPQKTAEPPATLSE